jgi:phosphotriesterase-related protein
MAAVPTVLGTVDSSELGTTLMHEHIVLVQPEFAVNFPGRFDIEAQDDLAHRELTALKRAGVDTVVDLTVVGLGRDVKRVRRIVDGTGLNAIVATGIYFFDDLPLFYTNRGPGTVNGGPDPVLEFLTQDIEQGIAGSGIRAGILKCVTDRKGLTDDIERVLRANARVHRATGVPITTHTDAATRRGIDQQSVFKQEGVDLSRVVIGHCGDSTDIGYLTSLMDAGSYIGLDRFGLETILSDKVRIQTLITLITMGYSERIVISHDTSCFSQHYEPSKRAEHLPHWKLGSIVGTIVPQLRASGVSEEIVHQLLVVNPSRIFGHTDPY